MSENQYPSPQPDPSSGAQASPSYGQSSGAQPDPSYGAQPGQGWTALPPTDPSAAGQASGGDPYAGQPSAGQPSAGQPYGGQPSASQPHAGQAAGAAPVVGPKPGTDLAADLGAALSFAGRALLRNPVTYLVVGAIYFVVIMVISAGAVAAGVGYMLSQADALTGDEPPIGMLLVMYAIVFGIVLLAVPVSLLWESGSGRAAEIVLEGGRPSIGQAMVGPGRIILTALLVGLITGVGTLLLYIPGLIASVLMFYAIPAAARGASPVAAVKESFALARANLGTTIVAWLILNVISSVAGGLIIGIVVALPFIILFQLGMYERISGRALPEPAMA
ncbi:hypothetical protein ACXET9_02575 [Brachybacterium sp. DNPG3]